MNTAWKATGWIVAATLAVGAIAAGAATASPEVAPEVAPRTIAQLPVAPSVPTEPITVAAIGDSLTAWVDYDGNFADTWVSHLPSNVVHVGGYAAGGAPTVVMRDSVTTLDADVAVILAGTNDVAGYPSGVIPAPEILANIDSIVATVAADDVLIVALGPSDKYTTQNLEFNVALKAHAEARGWAWTDPWVAFRATGGTFIPGSGLDGVHPVPEVQVRLGELIGCSVLELRGYGC